MMSEATLWFLLIIGAHGQTSIHEVPYAVEWECQHQAEQIMAKSSRVTEAFCFSSSAIDVNAWNHSQAGEWRFTEYE